MSMLEEHKIDIQLLKAELNYLKIQIKKIQSYQKCVSSPEPDKVLPDGGADKTYVSIVKALIPQLKNVQRKHHTLEFICSQMKYPVYKQLKNLSISKECGIKIGFFVHSPAEFGISEDQWWFSMDDFKFSNKNGNFKTLFICDKKEEQISNIKNKCPPFKLELVINQTDALIKKEIEDLNVKCEKLEKQMGKMIIPEIKKFHTLGIKKQTALDSGLFIHSLAEFGINKKATECWYSMYDFNFIQRDGDKIETIFI